MIKLILGFCFILINGVISSDLDFVSEEVDSSEYGVSPGPKSTNCSCGWTNKEVGRIVGGQETAPNEYPLMAGLADGEFLFMICGASVISPFHGLTAAHCTVNRKGKPLALIVGDHNVMTESADRRVHSIKDIVEHENYNTQTQQYDIALLVLNDKIEFNSLIGPACLPSAKLDLTGQTVKILGWGRIRAKGARSKVLKKVNVKVVPIKNCVENLAIEIPTDNPHQICTFGHRKDACQGDSGGPVIWLDPETNRYTQIGIVSFGAGCGGSTPAVNSDLSFFLDWLQTKIAETAPDGRTCSKTN